MLEALAANNDPQAMEKLAPKRYFQGDVDGAIELLLSSARISQKGRPLATAALLERERGDWVEAVALIRAAAILSPDSGISPSWHEKRMSPESVAAARRRSEVLLLELRGQRSQ